MEIMLLWSSDGQDYTWPVVVPIGMDHQTAWDKAHESIAKAKDAKPDDYTQADIQSSLEADGFVCPDYFQGPLWD